MPPRPAGDPSGAGTTRIPAAPPRPQTGPPPVPAPPADEPQTTRLSIAKNVVRNAVTGAAAAAQRAARPEKSEAPPPREEREIESWLGDLRGNTASGAGPAGPPQPMRPSAEPTRAMPDTSGEAAADDSDDAATRAIPAQRKPDAETATEKLNTRPDDDTPRRGGGGLSAQDLLRREGRL